MLVRPTPPVLRFAPSPNGYLHIGHAYSALVNQRMARRLGGRLLLRIEDIDTGRCRPDFEQAVFDDLEWLGIEWEKPVRRQSGRFAIYAAALESLVERGLAYPCFCVRSELNRNLAARRDWPRDPDGVPLYSGECRHMSPAERQRRLAAGQSAAVRINMDEMLARVAGPLGWREFDEGEEGRDVAAEPAAWGDAIIGRRDVPASYHLCVVIDDADQGVTDVVRGMDLFAATSLHRLLQETLDLPAPNYRHHELLRDASGAKLSKSARAPPLRSLRLAGRDPAGVRHELGFD